MNPCSQLSTEALHTMLHCLYIVKINPPKSQSSTGALHTVTLLIYS